VDQSALIRRRGQGLGSRRSARPSPHIPPPTLAQDAPKIENAPKGRIGCHRNGRRRGQCNAKAVPAELCTVQMDRAERLDADRKAAATEAAERRSGNLSTSKHIRLDALGQTWPASATGGPQPHAPQPATELPQLGLQRQTAGA